MKRNITILFVAIVLLASSLAVFYTIRSRSNAKKMPPGTAINNAMEQTFANPTDGSSVTVIFDNTTNTAVLSGVGYTDLALNHEISASGARYVNEAESIELWNKGNTITISQNGIEIFSGSAQGQAQQAVEGLTGITWIWQETQMNNDEVIVPTRPEAFSVTFSDNGSVAVATDCNNGSGTYAVDNNRITFGDMSSTLMFCEGSQETEFRQMLAETESYMFNENGNLVLLLAFDSGSIIFRKQ